MSSDMWREMQRASGITGLGGFKSLDNLRSEQRKFEAREAQFQAESNALQDQIRRDRMKAAGVISGSGTPEALDAAVKQVRSVRDAEMIEQGNKFGFNPSAGMRSADQELNTLQQALALVQGRQNIALTSLTGSPSAPLAIRLTEGGRSVVGGQNAAILGSGELGGRNAEAEGAGIAGAGNVLSDMFLLLAGRANQERQKSSGQLQEELGSSRFYGTPSFNPYARR